ncbi:hypothetical protein GCM10027589_12070 [Actinocorallia lasiicapitis]
MPEKRVNVRAHTRRMPRRRGKQQSGWIVAAAAAVLLYGTVHSCAGGTAENPKAPMATVPASAAP